MNKKQKLILIFGPIIGAISILLILIDFFNPFLIDYAKGFFLSFGISILILSVYYSTSKKFKKKFEINSNDERIQMIENKVFSLAYIFHMILFLTLIIIFAFRKDTQLYSIILAFVIMIENIFTLVTRFVLNKKL